MMYKRKCPVCNKEMINLSTNPMVGIYQCDCGWKERYNKYDILAQAESIRCVQGYIANVIQGDFDIEKVTDVVRNIRKTLEESEQNGFTIDDSGIWYKNGKRLAKD